MKYLCLVYQDETQLEALSASEYAALVGEALDYPDELRNSDHYIASHALQSVRTATG